jgi:isopentenyl diphosphate isomerase/L-lactate dehydrogenase-like FMN-dependent dehydrogenase
MHAATRRLPCGLFGYIDRGSEDEISIATNRSRIDSICLAPAVLVDGKTVQHVFRAALRISPPDPSGGAG